MDKNIYIDCRHILYNKDHIVIRSLLDFFEDETIDSFHLLKLFPAMDIEQYLHDCCSITIDVCRSLWTRIERYNISDILPSDDIIQKYMSYMDNRPVEQYVLDEIKEYEKRLNNRLTNGKSGDKVLITALDEYNGRFPDGTVRQPPGERIPPFPLLDIYEELQYLSSVLEQKKTFFALSIVTEIGRLKEGHPAEKDLMDRDLCLDYILQDKRFIELTSALKHSFDAGYERFSEKYHSF